MSLSVGNSQGIELQPGRNRLNDRDIELGSAQVNEYRFKTATCEGIPQDGELIARAHPFPAAQCRAVVPAGAAGGEASASISVARARCRRSVALSAASPRCRILLAAIGKASSIWHIFQNSGSHSFFQRQPRPRDRQGQSAAICVD